MAEGHYDLDVEEIPRGTLVYIPQDQDRMRFLSWVAAVICEVSPPAAQDSAIIARAVIEAIESEAK